MKRKVCLLALGFYFFFFAPGHVLAKIWINEFSSYESSNDWVELYNDDANSIDLSLYILRDESANNKVFLTGELQPGGFLEVPVKNYLNKDGDTIKIVYSNDETNIVDQVSYGNSGGDSPAPQEGQSAGRSPDGNAQWVVFSNPSRGSSNETSQIVPTPTLTPTRTPTPTKVPTPTKIPTSTKAPTMTKTPTRDLKKTEVRSAKVKHTEKSLPKKESSGSSYPTPVLKDTTRASTASKKLSDEHVLVKESSQNITAAVFLIGGGLFLTACAILVYRRIKYGKDIYDE